MNATIDRTTTDLYYLGRGRYSHALHPTRKHTTLCGKPIRNQVDRFPVHIGQPGCETCFRKLSS